MAEEKKTLEDLGEAVAAAAAEAAPPTLSTTATDLPSTPGKGVDRPTFHGSLPKKCR